MKTLSHKQRLRLVICIWISVLSSANTDVFSQTANDTITSKIKTTLPSASLKEDSVKDVASEIAEPQRRKDVKTSIEVSDKGDTIIHYIYEPFDFGEIYTSKSSINAKAKKAPVSKVEAPTANEPLSTQHVVTDITVQTIDPSKSVGQIPFEESVTSTGGKTVTVPILTATVVSATPQVALSYNSQMGNSMAGYGWNIAGLSSINVSNKTIYYDGANAPIDLSNPSACVFSLDGTRLVANNNSALPDYHYETAQGYIFVKKVMSGSNVAYFEALFPNGSKATFGFIGNTSMQHTYPITSIVDLKGYRIDFEYLTSGNMYFISKIKYGGKTATSHPAEIRFEYVARTDYATVYISNTAISQNQLLKKITSFNNNQEIRTYTLTHELIGESNRLMKLDCSSGTSSLNPLVFGYDFYPSYMSGGQMYEDSYGFLSSYFNNDPVNKMQFIRGKFRKNSFGDGMITFPGKFSIYGLLATRKRWVPFHYIYAYLYGSNYPANQEILIAPTLDFFSSTISILAESGFQTINAVDVNGDGVDEIVKVNFNGTSGTKTILKITVYTLTTGTSYATRTFNVQVEGVVNSDDYYYSPISRSYYFGDFKGDGKVQLLTVSHNKTFLNQDRTSYFALIDLNSGSLLSENTLFSHSTYEDTYVHTFDVNGDGKTELCHAGSSGYEVYALSGNSFVYQYTSSVIPRSAFYKKVKFGDLNADGKLDILVPPNDSYQDIRRVDIPVWAPHYCPFCEGSEPITDTYSPNCRHCNENLQQYYAYSPYYASCRECGAQLQLCNNDPYNPSEELCCPYHGSYISEEIDFGYVDNGNTWTCYLNTGKGFTYTSQNIVNTEYGDKITVIDMNRDGLSDLIQLRGTQAKLYLNSKGIIQSTTNINPITVVAGSSDFMPSNVINYYNSSYLVCIKNAEIYTITFTKDESKANLLTSMTDSYGDIHQNSYSDMAAGGNYISTTTYRYYPYASSVFPLNLLGSATVSLPNYGDYVSNRYYTYYGAVIHQQGLGFCGFEKIKTLDMLQNMESVETKNPEMFGVTTSMTSPFKDGYYYYERNEESNKQANPRMYYMSETDKLTNVYSYANYYYDAYNNPTEITMNYGSSTLNTVTEQTYYNSVTSSRYLLGQPLVKTVTTTRNGVSWQDKEEITYNDNRLPASRITYTGSTAVNKTGETRWTYDTNGNMNSEKSAPYNVTEFLGNTYTYDPSGRYLATQTNALLQTNAFSNYDKYGNAHTITDYKGRVTTRVFDDWGQLVSATNPDGVVESTAPAWGGQGVYTVTSSVTGKPSSIVHYDAAGREIRKGSQRFDGSWQFVDNTYDNKGRLQKVSLPFKGTSPTYWNTYTYDIYNRPTQLSEASGKTTTWSYNGLSVTETKNGIAVTKTTDESGALISVTDPGGILTYALRPDGQPSSVTAPGSVVTTFGYDAFGRQTSIADPSAGTQTFGDVYSAAGVLTRTVIDANSKTVTTVYDKYGRVTSVTRPEFNTSYEYNTDGLLTSETSTNGTSATFTYDTFDRPLTTKEIVPDGKYLQKEYTYAAGNVATVKYTSQSGLIGTEYFTYAYGHNTEIKLNNTTSIWKLTAENALGQPTQATTGPMTRTYGYTAYGMPTGRTAGTVQSFTYNFDVTKGNLTSRTDATRNKAENFGYDNLNRLSSIGTQTITYADNGNITQMPGVGTMAYENAAKPYQVTLLTPTGSAVPMREQTVTYTSYQRPNTLTENGVTATFTYNAAGDRVKMNVMQASTALLTRYYLGGQYELDAQNGVERLYMGGDVYSAPTVYVKEGGVWQIYYICRDYLGSITHVANADGSLKAEYSYDAWGRLRDPATQTAYTSGSEPALFLDRGYTGHEYLPWFGLINANARLYDPALGRFLSPDPYVQMPDFSQNLNRYSYCLNNPLIYSDITGKYFGIDDLIGALIGGVINLVSNWNNLKGDNIWQTIGRGFAAFGAGAAGGVGALYPEFGGWAWGGATVGATNAWLGGAKGWNIALGAGIGVISGVAGGAAGQFGAKSLGGLVINGVKITSPVTQGAITGAIGGAAGGYVGGFTGGLIMTGDFEQANQIGLKGLWSGTIVGGVVGAGAGYKYAIDNNIDPWSGVYKNSIVIGEGMKDRVGPTANDLNAETISKDWPNKIDAYIGKNMPTGEGLEFNSQWIQNKIDNNYHIYDIGPKLNTVKSPFYNLEVGRTLGYPNLHRTYIYNVGNMRVTFFK